MYLISYLILSINLYKILQDILVHCLLSHGDIKIKLYFQVMLHIQLYHFYGKLLMQDLMIVLCQIILFKNMDFLLHFNIMKKNKNLMVMLLLILVYKIIKNQLILNLYYKNKYKIKLVNYFHIIIVHVIELYFMEIIVIFKLLLFLIKINKYQKNYLIILKMLINLIYQKLKNY